MRLIDADLLTEAVSEMNLGRVAKSNVIYKISEQPTAYDVDAVIMLIEEVAPSGLSIREAIDIVEKGGTE